ncbi:MAG: UMP kinase [Clostridia bacterium]|nr:UMP kinase [Clostridia bacterium]
MTMPKYKKVLLKLSGEALLNGKKDGIIDFEFVDTLAKQIKRCVDDGVSMGIVIGGGNIWRGAGKEINRTRADHMGMLATVINSLAVQSVLEENGIDARTMTALQMNQIAEPYIRNRAVSHMEKGRVVIIACGSGNPYFSTDTAAVLRAAEIGAEVVLFAKNIDGVYSADPKKDPNAVKYDKMKYDDIIHNDLTVIDSTASTFGRDNKLPILIFGLNDPENIYRAVNGESIGTIVNI